MREQSDVGLIYRLADEGIVGIQDEEGYFTEKNTMEEVQLKTLKNRSWADVKRAYVELEPNKKSGTAYYEVEIPKYEDGNKPRVTVITGDKNNYLPLLGDIIASKEVEDGTLQVYSTPLESDEEIKGVKVVVGLATGGDHASYIVIEQDEFHIKEPEPEPEPENKEIELEVTGESEYYNTDINGDRKNLLKEEVEYGKRDGKLYGEEIELKQSYKYTESKVNKGDTIKFTLKPISEYHKLDRVEKTMLPEVELKGKQELDNGEVEYTYEVISEDMDVGEQKVDIQAYYKPKSYEDYHAFYEEGFKLKDGKVLNYHIVPRTFTIDDFEVVDHVITDIQEGEFIKEDKEYPMNMVVIIEPYFGGGIRRVDVFPMEFTDKLQLSSGLSSDWEKDFDIIPKSIKSISTNGFATRQDNIIVDIKLEKLEEITELYEEDNIEIVDETVGIGLVGDNDIYQEKAREEVRNLTAKFIVGALSRGLDEDGMEKEVDIVRETFKITEKNVSKLTHDLSIKSIVKTGKTVELQIKIEQDINPLWKNNIAFNMLQPEIIMTSIGENLQSGVGYFNDLNIEVGIPTELKIGNNKLKLDIPNLVRFGSLYK